MDKLGKWDERFLDLCQHVSLWSKDPSTRVGAVIVDSERRIVGMGYNGFPRGVHDDALRYNNKAQKNNLVVHAEANAILNAVSSVKGCTVYVWPLFTCNECAKLVIQSGIKRVVSIKRRNSPYSSWTSSQEIAQQMYKESGVEFKILEY